MKLFCLVVVASLATTGFGKGKEDYESLNDGRDPEELADTLMEKGYLPNMNKRTSGNCTDETCPKDRQLGDTALADTCSPRATIICRGASRFRSIDGTCNNLWATKRRWGSANIPFRRFLPGIKNMFKVPVFLDPLSHRQRLETNSSEQLDNYDWFGIKRRLCSCKRKSECVERTPVQRPGARLVSSMLHPDQNESKDQTSLTLMAMQFGQFLDHDIVKAASQGGKCCPDQSSTCYSIKVSENDRVYAGNKNCLPFKRSQLFCNDTGRHEQINDVTAFIDGSQVYGSDDGTSENIRLFRGGKLKEDSKRHHLLPFGSKDERIAGDERVRENPGLASLHTLFLREHNRLCEWLRGRPGDWSDEDLYQNARRIMIAELQNIVYGEYLPVILTHGVMRRFRINLRDQTTYEQDTDPSIRNSFGAAAFRFGHSMIQGIFELFDKSGRPEEVKELSKSFFNMIIYQHSMEDILKGLVMQKSRQVDRYFTSEITNKLFRFSKSFGQDLVSMNIQRGRDHGLPSYLAFYEALTNPFDAKVDCWSNVPRAMPIKNWRDLQSVYLHPHHIDLFVGSMMEYPVNGAVTGHTMTYIIVRQFEALMLGDRFFFTHQGQFSHSEIQAITSRKLSDIICDNTKIEQVPTNAFRVDSSDNPMKDCSSDVKALDIRDFNFFRAE